MAFVPLTIRPAPVLAAEPEPVSVSLSEILIFNSLLVADDFLAFVPYDIPFAVAPDYNISDTFVFRLLSPDGLTEIGSVIASPAYDAGYGQGVVSFYVAAGMVSGSAYIFRVQQNPVHYPTPQYWDFTTSNSTYSTESDQAGALRTKVISSATSLTPQFGVTLLAKSEAGITVLSGSGETYYLDVIPGLQTMSPSLFSVEIETPDFTKRTWAMTFADALKTRYAGTFLEDFWTGYAGLFSIDTSPAMNFLSVVLFVVIIMFSVWKFKATMFSAMLDGYATLLLLMLMGFFSMLWAGFMAFILAAVGGAIIFFKRS